MVKTFFEKRAALIWIAIKIVALLILAVASKIWVDEVDHIFRPHADGTPPVWIGFGMLAVLMCTFGALLYWLYLSPIKTKVEPINTDQARRRRRIVGGLMLLASVGFITGGVIDALWHMWLGGFGNDFLWPPHLIIYGSFLLNTIVAGVFLGRIMYGKGDPRLRARQEPALGIAALASAYLIFSMPSDLVWHQIYGIDISVWSLPHFLIMVMSSVTSICITGLLVSSLKPGEKSRLVQLGVIILMTCSISILMLGLSSEYDWGQIPAATSPFWARPAWVYPMIGYMIGLLTSLLIANLLDLPMSATCVALLVLLSRFITGWAASTLPMQQTMQYASHTFFLLPAIAFDICYLWLRHKPMSGKQKALIAGSVYLLVFWAFAFLRMTALNIVPAATVSDLIVGPAIAFIFLLLFGLDMPNLASALRGQHAEVEAPKTVPPVPVGTAVPQPGK